MNLSFLRDLLARPGAARTVILLDPATMSEPRQYEVRPNTLLYGLLASTVLGALVLLGLLWLTPLRRLVTGPDIEELRGVAERNARLAAAFEDSVALQYQQITQLRALITGDLDSLAFAEVAEGEPVLPDPAEVEAALGIRAADSAREEAPPGRVVPPPGEGRPPTSPPGEAAAPDLPWLSASSGNGPAPGSAAAAYLSSLRLPALPPVDGVLTRGFNASTGHFGIDLAVRAGTPLRAVGDGYVVFADWTHEGGFTIAVQHADGYLSVYKHNQRLLKRVGDRVRSREAVALSGNTGEVTSGPHLHFELWRNGLAQDPRVFFAVPR